DGADAHAQAAGLFDVAHLVIECPVTAGDVGDASAFDGGEGAVGVVVTGVNAEPRRRLVIHQRRVGDGADPEVANVQRAAEVDAGEEFAANRITAHALVKDADVVGEGETAGGEDADVEVAHHFRTRGFAAHRDQPGCGSAELADAERVFVEGKIAHAFYVRDARVQPEELLPREHITEPRGTAPVKRRRT